MRTSSPSRSSSAIQSRRSAGGPIGSESRAARASVTSSSRRNRPPRRPLLVEAGLAEGFAGASGGSVDHPLLERVELNLHLLREKGCSCEHFHRDVPVGPLHEQSPDRIKRVDGTHAVPELVGASERITEARGRVLKPSSLQCAYAELVDGNRDRFLEPDLLCRLQAFLEVGRCTLELCFVERHISQVPEGGAQTEGVIELPRGLLAFCKAALGTAEIALTHRRTAECHEAIDNLREVTQRTEDREARLGRGDRGARVALLPSHVGQRTQSPGLATARRRPGRELSQASLDPRPGAR